MRPGQNNKRMRGRNNNNNRKSPNPLTRSYESNGPDVKIRGTAHHVAEKYLQLARDAQSSGDPVMAESYLQHAEHYFRLIAAAQAAQQQAQMGYQRSPNDPILEDEDEDDDFSALPDRFASPPSCDLLSMEGLSCLAEVRACRRLPARALRWCSHARPCRRMKRCGHEF